jgi:hypothetical protein
MLIAAPLPSTGRVARSPSFVVAMGPFANEFAGATVVVVVPVVAEALAEGLAEAPSAD